MLKKTIKFSLILIAYLFTCNQIYKTYTYKPTIKQKSISKITETTQKVFQEKDIATSEIKYTPIIDTSIGTLIIDKINLSQKLYPVNDKLNNIEKNVTILSQSIEPTEENSIMFIAAHSGTGKIAYFKNLDKLKINDTITLIYKNITYTYQIKDIWEIKKEGNISVEKEQENQLVLTTCSPTKDNYQLIINSIIIKKES